MATRRKRKIEEISKDLEDTHLHTDVRPPAKRARKTKRRDTVEQKETEAQDWSREKTLIESKYHVPFPDCFYHFWEWLQTLDKDDSCHALECINLHLVGPFELLNGELEDLTDDQILIHWRYYLDLPEFLTIVKVANDDNGVHWGYWRDEPSNLPVGIVQANGGKSCRVTPYASDLFHLVSEHMESLLSQTKASKTKGKGRRVTSVDDSFSMKRSDYDRIHKSMAKFIHSRKALHKSVGTSKTTAQAMDAFHARSKAIVAKAFHNFGIVVPLSENEIGYRPLNYTVNELKKIFKRMYRQKQKKQKVNAKELEIELTNVNLANDEGDPGMGYELGVNFWCTEYTEMFQKHAFRLLKNAYKLLHRDVFLKYLNAHYNARSVDSFNQLEKVSEAKKKKKTSPEKKRKESEQKTLDDLSSDED